jgi:hypothetical protein
MKSYTIGRNLYGSLTKNTASANLSLGDQIANDDYRAICAVKDWPFLERLRTLSTIASTQAYNLPYDCDQVREIGVIVSSKRYTPTMAPDRNFWDKLNSSTVTSDIPQYWFTFAGQLMLWPTPATAANTINVTQKTRVIDLSVADYTTGNITTTVTTAGVTTVTGSGTTWTPQMVGRYIRITYSDTALTGDGLWYEIASVPTSTTMTLVRAYGGTALAAATAAYTIGQMPLLPEAYHDLPWIWSAGKYWEKEADDRGASFLKQHGNFGENGGLPTGRIADLVKNWSSPNTDQVIWDGRDEDSISNPNLTIMI